MVFITALQLIQKQMMQGVYTLPFFFQWVHLLCLSNLWPEVGLCNGAVGRVHQIVYNEGQHPPDLPVVVIVHFENMLGHLSFMNIPSVFQYPLLHLNGVIQTIYQGNNSHLNQLMPLPYTNISQGQTLQKAVIDTGKSEHAPGTTFVAISRLPCLSCGLIMPICHFNDFNLFHVVIIFLVAFNNKHDFSNCQVVNS